MLKMQDSDGGVFHKVNTMNFPGALPSDDTQTRYIYEKGRATRRFSSAARRWRRACLRPWMPNMRAN